ncbi:MAG: T9SS type A sorting domain-containing protein [Ignavibacteria bacterium]|jgi:hypothetical protein
MKKILGLFFVVVLAGFTAAQTDSVTFNVDMGVQVFNHWFDPATDVLTVSGNFNGWNTTADTLTDGDADTVYTVTIDTFAVNDTLLFKFTVNSGYEGIADNRMHVVTAGSSVYSCYYNDDTTWQVTYPIVVTFQCNMEFESVSGRFDPANDTLSVRGGFNGWGANDIMDPSIGDPNIYEFTTDTLYQNAGDTLHYKFAYIHGAVTNWESGDDKLYGITATDISNGTATTMRTFNDLTLQTVTNQECTIKFTVDMDTARSSISGNPFSQIDNVVLCGANPPLAWPQGGWPDEDSSLTIKMYDDGTMGDLVAGDNIWSRDVVFAQYSPFAVEYKYGANWGLATNEGGNDNESGVGTNHNITLSAFLEGATVENVWSVMGQHTFSVTDVTTELPGIPLTYELAQNFPNPFNPTTSIRFSIPESGLVTLKVYNIMGEEVATLLNEVKNVGNYDVQFDASRLASGVYLYSITSGNFVSTKKMILLK